MEEIFFTTKQAAQVTGCTLRQLQYWREKGVVVPTIGATGTGRSIYYSQAELVELTTMEYWLSVGLNFEVSAEALRVLKENEPQFAQPQVKSRWMLCWDEQEKKLRLVEFDRERAIAFLDKGQPVIPVWLDMIHKQLAKKLEEN